MSKSYIVNLVYGYVQSDYGVEHSFLFLPPSATEGDREQVRAYLMDELDCTEEDIANGTFNWNSIDIELPIPLVSQIRADAINEILGTGGK